MAILAGDIKLVASQVMDDVPESGGAPTAATINDGVSNAIFNDISELDRAGGRVSLRKVFASVQTLNTDGYFGGNVIVADPPQDPLVSVALFSTGDVFDRRSDASNRVEAYLNAGPLWPGFLYENHIEGQRSIQIFARTNAEPPPIGRTLLLRMNEGLGTQYEQYVRVTAVESEVRTFTYGEDKDYEAQIITCSISDALRFDFPGTAANRLFTVGTSKTIVRDTVVADAATYFSASPLVEAAELGDLTVRAESMFAQIVPSAETEIPLPNQFLAGDAAPMLATSESTFTWGVPGARFANGLFFNLPTGCLPGSFVGPSGLTDDSFGNLVVGGNTVGTIAYETGRVDFTSALGFSLTGTVNVTYRPAAVAPQQSQTLFRPVTAENRRYNWIETLTPTPAPGTLSVAYMAQGRWYVLRDNGLGILAGSDTAFGAGTINYVNGSMVVTLGALPDAGSNILLTWATAVHYTIRTGAEVSDIAWGYAIGDGEFGIAPGTLTISWTAGGVTKTLSDDENGFLEGDGWGMVNYAGGQFAFKPGVLPDPGATPTVTYEARSQFSESFTPTKDGNGFVSVTVANTPIVPGSIEISWETIRKKTVSEKASSTVGGVSYFTSTSEYTSVSSSTESNSLSNDNEWSSATPETWFESSVPWSTPPLAPPG